MKRSSVVAIPAVSVLLAACAAAPRIDLAAEEGRIRELVAQIVVAENAKDVEKAVSFYAPDAHVSPANEPAVHGTDGIRQLYLKYFGMGLSEISSTPDHVEIAAGADMAYEYGTNRLKLTMADGNSVDIVGKYTGVWKKVNGEWKVAALSFSEDSPPLPSAPTPAARVK